jgi:hypothetical protein
MSKCYACERETDKNDSNTYFIRTGLMGYGKDEIIVCQSCQSALGKESSANPFGFPDGWYEFASLIEGQKKCLTKEATTYIKENKPIFKNWEKSKAKKEKLESNRRFAIAQKIIDLLNEKSKKMSVSDIAAFIKEDREEVKIHLQVLYKMKKIDFAGNGRYFILNPDKKKVKSKKTSAPKSEPTDIPEQIKKLSDLKDQGILTEEEFQSKKKDLLDKM